jgi:hypothetical protein
MDKITINCDIFLRQQHSSRLLPALYWPCFTRNIFFIQSLTHLLYPTMKNINISTKIPKKSSFYRRNNKIFQTICFAFANACAVRSTYSFLYVWFGLSPEPSFPSQGSQARGTRLGLPRLSPRPHTEALGTRLRIILLFNIVNTQGTLTKGPITWSIFNPGVKLSPVYRVEISSLSVIQNSIKIKRAITWQNFQPRAEIIMSYSSIRGNDYLLLEVTIAR